MIPQADFPDRFRPDPLTNESFIVKIWIEEDQLQGRRIWRGSIRHVVSGMVRYVKSLDEISGYFRDWITAMRGQPGA